LKEILRLSLQENLVYLQVPFKPAGAILRKGYLLGSRGILVLHILPSLKLNVIQIAGNYLAKTYITLYLIIVLYIIIVGKVLGKVTVGSPVTLSTYVNVVT
jgi:hypothetical protein